MSTTNWLAHGSSSLEPVGTTRAAFVGGWDDWIWYESPDLQLVAVHVDDLGTPIVVDDSRNWTGLLEVGPSGALFTSGGQTELFHYASPTSPARLLSSLTEGKHAVLALDERRAYFIEDVRSPTDNALVSVDLADTTRHKIATVPGYCRASPGLAIGGGYAYTVAANADLSLYGVDLRSGAVRLVHSTPVKEGFDLTYVAANSEYVYWTVKDTKAGSTPSAIYQQRHCGGLAVRIADVPLLAGFTADDDGVYWTTWSEVVRF